MDEPLEQSNGDGYCKEDEQEDSDNDYIMRGQRLDFGRGGRDRYVQPVFQERDGEGRQHRQHKCPNHDEHIKRTL